jgi:hypothetical protein
MAGDEEKQIVDHKTTKTSRWKWTTLLFGG